MSVKYLDPYKDDKYGKLRGDKSESYFKLTFREAKLYTTDNACILAGEVTSYQGIPRNYKPEQALERGLCAVPFYCKEYEVRRKDGEAWVTDKIKPSVFEVATYSWLKGNESNLLSSDSSVISGDITHVPNGMCANLDTSALQNLINSNIGLHTATGTGSLPAYEPPKDYAPNRGGGRNNGLSPDEKMLFLKKQIVVDIVNPDFNQDMPLLKLIEQMLVENPMEKDSTTLYFDCLLGCVR
jgi:hypothetical protein